MKPPARLIAILSGVAFVAFAMRAAAFGQAMASVGGAPDWSAVVGMEIVNWLAWSLWAAALVPLVARMVADDRTTGLSLLRLAAVALAPTLFIPAVVGAIHRIAFVPDSTLLQSFGHVLSHNLPLNLLLGVTLTSIANGYLGRERTRRLEVTAERLNAELTRAQLETLRSQLNPHFLFNALNVISVQARRGNTQQVEEMIGHLAALLRHSLDSARTEHVPLRIEIDALRHYVDIERIRHGDRLVIDIDVPDALAGNMVPSFLLQPLVENAIRHGGADAKRSLHVRISACLQSGRLILAVSDDGMGLPPQDLRRDGVGLGNTRARLAGMYGAGASLTLGPGLNACGTIVEIAIPDSAFAESSR